uniref:Cytochrome P450 n=1 Tax=Physcomitrium patens TaxID=3218 RepID=A0A7I4AJ94_PHYPA
MLSGGPLETFSVWFAMNGESSFPVKTCLSLTWVTAESFLVAAIAWSFAAWIWWHWREQRKLPGPFAWPLIGCLPELSANWDRLHDWVLEQFSDDRRTIYVQFGYPDVAVFTVDPANVEHLLKTNFSNYPKGESNCNLMRELFGVGIFTTDGELWKEQRRMASYEFSSASLRDFSTDVFREYALKLVFILSRFASTGADFDLQEMCMRMTLGTTCKIGFGVVLDCLSPSLPKIQFAQCFDDANFISYHRFVDPLWHVKRALNIGRERKLKHCVKVLNTFTYNVIEKRRQEMASFNTKPAQSDLLSRLTDLCNRGGEISHYVDTALRDMILNFIVAGRDTTAGTLTWFFYMMSSHPEIADKIFDELSTVVAVAGKHSEELTEESVVEFSKLLTYEKLGKLHYLHAALSETLRLYPAVPLVSVCTLQTLALCSKMVVVW